jgi:uncharacterized repeat protein (TIGR03803 family)
MGTLRVHSNFAASALACVRLGSVIAFQSALLMLCAQTPVIYSFGGSPSDGANPHRAVAVAPTNGVLYGTTVYGGSANLGVVYKLVPRASTWTESLLHNFAGAPTDGGKPDGDLLLIGSNLYGTASVGGTTNNGTVFQEKNSAGTWTESSLYNFAGGSNDGNGPFAGVISNAGVLYGTTFYGGPSGNGTAFSLTHTGSTWTENVIWKFGTGTDGKNPHAALVSAGNGVYYGTTYNGGTSGHGTVFRLTNSGGTWAEAVLYSFTGASDGSNPHSALIIDSSGALYGTTVLGGANRKGTVYKLTPGTGGAWTESVLYSFGATSSDGSIPRAGVIFGSTQGVLYGATTSGGGSSNCTGGCGTVYQLTLSGTSWAETIKYSFTGSVNGDGTDPYSDVVLSGGWIYGTTYNGGTSTNCTGGCGTVYRLLP